MHRQVLGARQRMVIASTRDKTAHLPRTGTLNDDQTWRSASTEKNNICYRSWFILEMVRLFAIAIVLCACGSKTLSPAASRIREGSELELTDCEVLQKVNASGSDERSSKNAAKEKAAALGATHILWIVPCCTYVEGNAYRCDAPD